MQQGEANQTVLHRHDIALLDVDNVVYGLVLKIPKGWEDRILGVSQAIQKLRAVRGAGPPPAHRRGVFHSVKAGFSYGGGQQVRKALNVDAPRLTTDPRRQLHSATLGPRSTTSSETSTSLRSWSTQKVRGHRSTRGHSLTHLFDPGPFSTWFPEQCALHRLIMDETSRSNPEAKPPIPGGSFSAMTVNLGPKTVASPHRDVKNYGPSVCFDYADGDFNWRRGGHLILHEPRKIIELPPGCIVLFPSACITHENVPIGDGETRNSITAYMAGGLLQHLEQGRRTQGEWKRDDPEGFREYCREGEARWKSGIAMFRTVTALRQLWVEL